MGVGGRIILLVIWLFTIFTGSLLLFSKGFLLKRIVMNNVSECNSKHWLVNNLWNGVTTNLRLDANTMNSNSGRRASCDNLIKPRFKKAIIVVIDGLRYDFLTYNKSLDIRKVLPFEHKMVKLHRILEEQPNNGKLYMFEADPPTTTMQRIKGITTGSLPTFIDAGANFNSYEITEDNILSQALKQNKNISFMGCSTWTELFPTHFNRKIPFSALNVKDLDTIDYGIIKHLIPEVKRTDWSFLIAHFLGVDHCGHRYGTHHPEMTRKLTEMDKVISDLTEAIDEETVLFVMGDHGMTRSGDHGGDSKDEVMAGLFTYSKKGLFHSTEDSSTLPQVSQIDMVPTLSLLLDQPIPFSNLGSIIPEFFLGPHDKYLPQFLQHSLKDEKHKKLASKLFQQVNAAYSSFLNCKQLFRFVDEYQTHVNDLPVTKLEVARASFEFLEEKYQEYLEEILTFEWNNSTALEKQLSELEESIQELNDIHKSLQDVLHSIKATCRSVWAKFDLVSMTMGLSLMAFIACMTFASSFLIRSRAISERSRYFVAIYILGVMFCVVAIVFSAFQFYDNDTDSTVVFLAVSFSFSLWLLSNNITPLLSSLKPMWRSCTFSVLKKQWFLVAVCFIGQSVSLFANSYIIYEDSVMLFLCQTFVIMSTCSYFFKALQHMKTTDLKRVSKSKAFVLMKTRIIQLATSTNSLKVFAEFFVTMLCIRLTKNFWFCREMQLKCSLSPYALPLVSLLSEFTEGYAHERLLVAIISTISITWVTYYYLKKQGNLKGTSPTVVIVKVVSVVMATLISLHWCLQIMLTHNISKLFDSHNLQQIVIPRCVYILFIMSLVALVWQPLSVYQVIRNNKINYTGDVAEIYHQLKSQLANRASQNENKSEKAVVIYGLRTVYSSSFIVLLFLLIIVTCMVMTDGMVFPLLCLWLASFFMCKRFTIERRTSSFANIFVSMVMWTYLSSFGFYGSGHQTTIPAIRFHAAYIGFKGSIPEIVPQVLVILLNTFASQIICGFALPLIMIFQQEPYKEFNPDMKKQANNGSGQSEVDILENQDLSWFDLFRIVVVYIALLMLKVTFAAGSAALHRRHLMVWKIFAPRFMFEAVGYLLSVPVLCLSLMYFNRVDKSLRKWVKKLKQQ